MSKIELKKFMSTALVLMLVLASLLVAISSNTVSADSTFGDFSYNLTNSDTTAEISKYYGSASSVVIPSSIDGKTVTSIGRYAFHGNSALTSLTIPSTVTSIGEYAFVFCTALTSVSIPSGVTAIGSATFDHCTALTSVTIPDSVTSIYSDAFYRCSSLTSVTIPDSVTYISTNAFNFCEKLETINVTSGNLNYASVDGILYNKEITDLILCPGGKIGAVSIPGTVISIGKDAFMFCSELTSVTIPSSVTFIWSGALEFCEKLTTIDVTSGNLNYASVDGILYNKEITDLVQCPGGKIGAVAIPATILSINDNTFQQRKNLTSVTIPDSVKSIGGGAFYDCSALTSMAIGKGVTAIGESAFVGCVALTSVTIPAGVTSIANNVFTRCSSLTAINVDSRNPSYASVDGVLYNKSITTLIQFPGGKVGAFTIPSSVTTIGYTAFSYCTLSSVTIPGGVTSIGYDVFYNCEKLTIIDVKSGNLNYASVDGILYNKEITALIKCPNGKISAVTIPDTVMSIENYAFNNCLNLTSVTIPGSVTSIGYDAFYHCSALTSVTIPGGVTSIGYGAFSDCTSLTSITFPGLMAPTNVVWNWIEGAPTGIRGHAYATSNFPAPGGVFNGLTMGTVLTSKSPEAPTNFFISPGNTQATLSWAAPTDTGGSPITGYRLYRSSTSTGNFSLISPLWALNYTDTGLTNGQTYWYKVSATNSVGEGSNCTAISVLVTAGGDMTLMLVLILVAAVTIVLFVVFVMQHKNKQKRAGPPGSNHLSDPGQSETQAPTDDQDQ